MGPQEFLVRWKNPWMYRIVTAAWIKLQVLQMAPTGRNRRCEIGRSRRPQKRSFSSYPSIWVVRVENLLYVAGKMSWSSVMHKPHSLLRCQWQPSSSYSISSVENINRSLLRVEVVARKVLWRPYHSLGGYSPVSHSGGPGLCPRQSIYDLWWTKLRWDRFFSESFGFPLSVSFHRCSIFTRVSSGGWKMGPLAAAVPKRHSLTPK
jgi:hypothetical protein